MELVKQNIRFYCAEKCIKKNKMMDEDYNVSDSKGDIRKVVCSTYEPVIEGMRAVEQKEIVSGYLEFDIMYAGQENGVLEHLEGKIPFEETFDMGTAEGLNQYKAKLEVDDFCVKIINSRKVNIKALLVVECFQDEILEDEMVTDVKENDFILRKENLSYTQIKACCEDQYRVKEELELPKNKPNIECLIWKNVCLKSHETKLLDDCVYIKGDIGVFVIYKASHEAVAIQWYETTFPFEGKIDVSGAREGMYSFVPLVLQETQLTVKQDADGEERVLCVEGMIKADIKAYSDEETDVVWDLYSCDQHVDVIKAPKKYQQILVKNCLKARGYTKVKMSDLEEKPLQICYSYGNVHLERCETGKNEMNIEGYVDATVIYISANDEMPIAAVKCQVPFSQMVAIEEYQGKMEYQVGVGIDQINTSMISNDEIEVRAFVDIELLMLKNCEEEFVVDATERPMSGKEMNDLPDMVAYLAPQNETMWNVAKNYKTTVEQIRKYNKNASDCIKKGEKILIVR